MIDKERATQFLQALVQINSVNPPANELVVAHKIAEHCTSYGLEVDIQMIDEARANIIVKLLSNEKEKCASLLFSGHLDTVPVGDVPWHYEPFSADIVDGKMYGRGTADMKGGVAALLEAMIILKEKKIPLKGDLLFLGTAGEEVDCIGAKQAIESDIVKKAGTILIAEPSSGEIFCAHKGVLWLEIETFGKTAHSSMPQNGINAIAHMHKIISALQTYSFRKVKEHPLLGRPTLVISTIKGGVTTNVIPDYCAIRIDIRSTPLLSHQEIVEDIKEIIRDIQKMNDDCKAKINVMHDLDSIDYSSSYDLLAQLKQVKNELFNVNLMEQGVNYYTDGSVFSVATNAPIIIYGPGNENLAHQPNEHIEMNEFFDAIEFYRAFAERYLT
ncbi:M20 family metallopeptidase [Lysinibacillus sp. Y5S-8]|uniref:M20 family metallopeptidase n=1 Tax=Lysinibacillus sp. Y5S-8 TaxID=3122488 RepID=UPI0030CC6D4D